MNQDEKMVSTFLFSFYLVLFCLFLFKKSFSCSFPDITVKYIFSEFMQSFMPLKHCS